MRLTRSLRSPGIYTHRSRPHTPLPLCNTLLTPLGRHARVIGTSSPPLGLHQDGMSPGDYEPDSGPDNISLSPDGDIPQPTPSSLEGCDDVMELMSTPQVSRPCNNVVRRSSIAMGLQVEVMALQRILKMAMDENTLLSLENLALRKKVDLLRHRPSASQLTSNDTATHYMGQLPSGKTADIPPCPNPSSICPSMYDPVDICWTKADYVKNPDAKINEGNRARPNMQIALRIPGTKSHVSAKQYQIIRSVAAMIARTDLESLPDPKNPLPARGKGRTLQWYKVNYPVQFRNAKERLESMEPI
ncbi:hypothetical protein NMY22_g6868 [Coprinellus aureogranulatus]|nr:hypothetical protein NMY22_g6868 [Coprinellus aureogranulatus]